MIRCLKVQKMAVVKIDKIFDNVVQLGVLHVNLVTAASSVRAVKGAELELVFCVWRVSDVE